ncbi:MAG: hypothetical protein JSW34_09315 [Candidatus Zixiibacteriota bacterium]|nr:MAG: hypothetical protein JSW34_09315 [candidate division Zixibacteria bacterium]
MPISVRTARPFHTYRLRYGDRMGGRWFSCQESGEKLRETAVYLLFHRASKQLGFTVYSHLLRHIVATRCLVVGMSGHYLRRLPGLTSARVLSDHCIHVDKETLRRVHEEFSPLTSSY